MFHILHKQMMFFFIVPFGVTLALLPITIQLARRFKCVDEPGGRRIHDEPTPRWGGIAFFLGILPIFCFIGLGRAFFSYLAASSLLVVIGSVDDRRELGFTTKLFAMLAAITTVIFGGGLQIHQIGSTGALVS